MNLETYLDRVQVLARRAKVKHDLEIARNQVRVMRGVLTE